MSNYLTEGLACVYDKRQRNWMIVIQLSVCNNANKKVPQHCGTFLFKADQP